MRSKGGPHHEPHILVSGKDYSTHNEGINFVVVDYDSGIYPKQLLWEKPVAVCRLLTSCSDISKVAPKIFKSCPKSFHEKVAQKLLFINSKKSVSTTDESKSLHIYTNYLLIYILISTRWHFYTYRDDILVSPPVYLILHSLFYLQEKSCYLTFSDVNKQNNIWKYLQIWWLSYSHLCSLWWITGSSFSGCYCSAA